MRDMPHIDRTSGQYLKMLKAVDEGRESASGLQQATLDLLRTVREAIVNPDRYTRPSDQLADARAWVFEQFMERREGRKGEGQQLTGADVARQLHMLDTLAALLELHPAHDVPESLREVA